MKDTRDLVTIGNCKIGKSQKPFTIAEMSGNHNQSLERALEIVHAAAKSGANAVKLQTYTADTLTLKKNDGEFFISDPSSLWFGQSMHDLYQKAYTPWEWQDTIFNECRKFNLVCFSSPFDETSVDFLESLNCPCYKIASTENTDTLLLKKVAQTGKPVIMSTGSSTVEELGMSVRVLRENGCKDIILLKCTVAYPANPEDANLLTLPHMVDMFGCQVGLSDHTLGCGVAIASVVLGATVIEKHFTMRRSDGGVDSAFSMEPEEWALMECELSRAWQSIGHVHYGPPKANTKVTRRSLYVVNDLAIGDVISREDVRSIRPGLGLAVKELDNIIGMAVRKPIQRGTALTWDVFK